MKKPDSSKKGAEAESDDSPLRQIEHALRGLRYGTLTIIVQDGVVVQIDRTERCRLVPTNRKSS